MQIKINNLHANKHGVATVYIQEEEVNRDKREEERVKEVKEELKASPKSTYKCMQEILSL